ncbi:MAG: trypsin-like peptidase domain-containing protein, partial [Candidatus Dormibacteraceae bacterium]
MNAPNSPHRTPLSIIWSTCSTWLRGGPGRLLVAAILISALVSAAVTVGIQGLALRSNGTSIPLLGTRVSVSDDSAVASVTQKSAPAVVSILIQGSTAPAPSGFLVSSDGYIVTSAGAVVNAPRIQVELAGDTRLYDARVVDHDCQTGLVVLKVDQVSHPSSLTFGDSSVVQPGQTGILLGGAPTERSVVHRTVVSGVGRINSLANLFPESGDVQMSGLIEVDAPSDPLLNGAPLLSVDGQVVGLSIQTDIAGKQIDFVEPAGA